MTEHNLRQKRQHLMLFRLLEQVKAANFQLQHQRNCNELKQLQHALTDSNTELTRHELFTSPVFCPELKRLQLNSMQRLQQESSRLSGEVNKVTQHTDALQLAYKQCNYKAAAYRDAIIPVSNSLRERHAERQDQQTNALHYQRKYNGHG
jgi:uncharacterized protein YjiS (DUF1127 family)